MKSKIKGIITSLLLVVSQFIFAQGDGVEMADTMRSNGKIYVVVAVVVAILIGLILYLVVTDKKISKLEKEIESK